MVLASPLPKTTVVRPPLNAPLAFVELAAATVNLNMVDALLSSFT
ncbi:hypothetical protein [Mucilaginibacter phyllosphaerae]